VWNESDGGRTQRHQAGVDVIEMQALQVRHVTGDMDAEDLPGAVAANLRFVFSSSLPQRPTPRPLAVATGRVSLTAGSPARRIPHPGSLRCSLPG
jgi:hypothetical protein